MAYTAKQEDSVKIGLFWYNGAYRAFEAYPLTSLEVWNLKADAVMEFLNGQPFTEALSGFIYSNAESYRLMVEFDVNNQPNLVQTLSWQSIFNQLVTTVQRPVWATTANGAGTSVTSLVLASDAPTVDDYFNGAVITSLAGGDVIITDYVGSTRTCTLASAKTWLNGATITIQINPNFPTIIGLAISDNTSDVQYYNLESNLLGMIREFTIGRQMISVKLKSVERVNTIDESFIVNG